jgi:hypothetical protein
VLSSIVYFASFFSYPAVFEKAYLSALEIGDFSSTTLRIASKFDGFVALFPPVTELPLLMYSIVRHRLLTTAHPRREFASISSWPCVQNDRSFRTCAANNSTPLQRVREYQQMAVADDAQLEKVCPLPPPAAAAQSAAAPV